MATLPPNFNADEIEVDDFSPLPAGEYVVTIVESEMRENKKGTGEFLELTMKVRDGQQANRQVRDRLNLKHQSQDAVRIDTQKLAKICKAVGVLKPRDSVDLHNIPLVITVGVTAPNANGAVFNEVKNYKAKSSASQPPTGDRQANDAPPYKRTDSNSKW